MRSVIAVLETAVTTPRSVARDRRAERRDHEGVAPLPSCTTRATNPGRMSAIAAGAPLRRTTVPRHDREGDDLPSSARSTIWLGIDRLDDAAVGARSSLAAASDAAGSASATQRDGDDQQAE